MASLINRLELWIKRQDMSIRSFEKSIGASDGLIRRAISQGTDIQGKWILAIAQTYPDLSMDWLILGQGPIVRPAVKPSLKAYRHHPEPADSTLNDLLNAKHQVLILLNAILKG